MIDKSISPPAWNYYVQELDPYKDDDDDDGTDHQNPVTCAIHKLQKFITKG